MKTPIFVRPLSEEERESLQKGLRSKDTFTMRRSQMLLASSRGERAPKIALNLGCASQTVRDAIHDFNGRGLLALQVTSSRPKRTRDAFDRKSAEELREMLHRSPREFAYQTSLWTLAKASEAAFARGTHRRARLGGDGAGDAFAPARGSLDAGEAVDNLPRPLVRKKKRRRDRLMEVAGADPEWAVGFLDECWWSQVALPTLNAWAEEGKPPRLIQRSVAKDDPEPKAISCYGLYLPALDRTWIRFVDGRPISSITTRFLEWSVRKLEAVGKKVLVLIWDNASWHVSKEVRRWLGSHNRRVKESGEGVRIVGCLLPKQSPWLNAIEPK